MTNTRNGKASFDVLKVVKMDGRNVDVILIPSDIAIVEVNVFHPVLRKDGATTPDNSNERKENKSEGV